MAGRASNRPQRPRPGRWRRAFAIAGATAAAAFLLNLALAEVGPASAWGLTYGALAATLLVAAALYPLRRRAMGVASRRRLGGARAWLDLHLYGGLLFLLLVLMHSGFRVPSGAVTWWLWALSLWTVASGLVGRALQLWIPKTLGSGLGIEVLYERIPELIGDIRRQAEELVATCEEPVQALYRRRLAPALAAPSRRWIYYFDITGGGEARLKELDYLRRFLPPAEKEKLGELAGLYRAKLQVDAHYTLQQALRGWLWAHVPVSVVLLVLFLLHVFSVWYY